MTMKSLLTLTLVSALLLQVCCAERRHADEEVQPISGSLIEPDVCLEYNYRRPHCCTPPHCDFMVSWRDRGDEEIEFTLVASVSANTSIWAALGVSHTSLMGTTDVVTCWVLEDHPQIHHGWIPTDSRDVNINDQPELALRHINVTLSDGKLYCSFAREKSLPFDSNASLTDELSLSHPVYILTATGPLYNPDSGYQMGIHNKKAVSDCECDVTDCHTKCVCLSGVKYLLLKLHGVVMTIGFVFFMPTGALISRYYRVVFAASWFRAHVAMMIFSVLCGLTGLGLILGHTDGRFTVGYHQIVGVVCLSLSLIQPLVGCIRPKVGPTVRRRLFNIFHRTMALLILNLGVAALLLGMYMFGSTKVIWMLASLGLSVGTNMAFMLLLEFLTRTQKFSSTVLPPVGYHKVTKHDELSESEEEVFVRDLPSKLTVRKTPTQKKEPYRFEQALLLLFVVQSLSFAVVISGLIYFYDSADM